MYSSIVEEWKDPTGTGRIPIAGWIDSREIMSRVFKTEKMD
jgi:hypothetical protein